ncbi:MAG: DNA polymerase I [Planctomycetota bacterium]
MAKRLFLIDGTALAYRSYFAFAMGSGGGLTTKDGRPTAAVYGFLQTLRALLDREHPDAIAISFDGPTEELERTQLYPDYKSTREKMPDEMSEQLDAIEEVVRGYGIPSVCSPGHEADDVIGTLALQGRRAGMQVYIVTADKDFMQLVDGRIKLWNLRSSTTAPEIIGPKEVEAKFGVRPDQMIDLLALMGDSSDNIPGVPRIGQKTAAALLQEFDTLDAVLARTDEVKQRAVRENLQKHVDKALLSRDLVTIHTEVSLDVEIEDLRGAKPDREILEPLFRDLEFDSLLKKLPQKETPDLPKDYRIVRTETELEALLRELVKSGHFAIDAEVSSPTHRDAELVGIATCVEAGRSSYVPFNLDLPVLAGGPTALVEAFRPVLEDPAIRKTMPDTKSVMAVLRNAGVEVQGVEFDTMLASYCIAPGQPGGHGLDTLAAQYLSYTKIPPKELLGTGKKQKTFDQVDVELVGEYACENADFTWRMRKKLEPEIAELGLGLLYHDLEMPLARILLDMEQEGIAVDLDHLEKTGQELQTRIEAIEARIYERAGEPFNINSPAQIGEVLFERLEAHKIAGVRPKRTRTGQWKTDAAILEKLAAHHEVPELILDYRKLSKLKNTYVDSLPTMVNQNTGRIHTSFNQAVAATGRLSSDDPNLQNIPIRTKEGREVRRAFIPRDKGWVLLSADYSQIELRILAHLSGDPALVKAFNENLDIHARTAAIVHGIMPDMVTAEMRSQAKVINYGLMYGMGASRLANETGMTPPEAKKFINAYFRALPKVKDYLDGSLAAARTERCVRTLFGRIRPLPEIDSANAMQRIAAENMAVNSPLQGTAADIIKRAMLEVHRRLNEDNLQAKMILQVHDELVLDVPEAELDQVKLLLKECMEGAAELNVPLEVDMGHGKNWLEAH